MILWTRRMQWLKPQPRVFDGRPKIFNSVYKNFKETLNSKNWSAWRFYCLGEWGVDHPAETFLAVSKNDKKLVLFSKNPLFVFPQYVVMDTKNAVITTLPKNFWRKAEKFRSLYKNVKKTYNSKNDLHKYPIVSVNAVLTNPLKFSLQSPRKVINLYFFPKIPTFIFPHYVPMESKDAVITTLP